MCVHFATKHLKLKKSVCVCVCGCVRACVRGVRVRVRTYKQFLEMYNE